MQIHIARLGVYLCLEDSMRGVTHFDHLIKLYLYLWLYIFRCFKEHGISSTNISIKYVRLADSASAQRRGCQEGCCTGTEWFDHPGLSLASAGQCWWMPSSHWLLISNHLHWHRTGLCPGHNNSPVIGWQYNFQPPHWQWPSSKGDGCCHIRRILA